MKREQRDSREVGEDCTRESANRGSNRAGQGEKGAKPRD